jgi:hypothetical protein
MFFIYFRPSRIRKIQRIFRRPFAFFSTLSNTASSAATVSEDAGLEPKTFANFATVRRCNHSAGSHPQLMKLLCLRSSLQKTQMGPSFFHVTVWNNNGVTMMIVLSKMIVTWQSESRSLVTILPECQLFPDRPAGDRLGPSSRVSCDQ